MRPTESTSTMSRVVILFAVLALGAWSIGISARQALSQAALDATQIEQVKDNLYVITGSGLANPDAFSGGNVGVFVTDEGVTIVDTKLPGWGQAILDRIRTVTDQPVSRIINTHTHGDHTGSNEFFPTTVDIVAHTNTKTNMEAMEAFQDANAAFLPNETYESQLTLGSGDNQIDLYYFGAGHTNGDTFIVYPRLQVLQTGDMFPWRDAPFLDRSNGGSGVSFPATLAALLETLEGIDIVVPGHVPVTDWANLEEYQRYTADLLAAVRSAIAGGQDADQAVASIDLSDGYPAYDSTRVEAAIRAIYDELQ